MNETAKRLKEMLAENAASALPEDTELIAGSQARAEAARPDAAFQTGRGPTGRLRNFRAMSDAKLLAALEAVQAEANDPEALQALEAEASARNL